ncbi:MAG: AbrB/MazE/SpoVT family DNA-binding domain-containing protein [Candidatus Hydrothermarchaeales archaeon]
MEVSRLSSKFQITLPKRVREELGANEGDRIVFVKDNDRWVLVRLPSDPVKALKHLGRKAKLSGTAREVHREMEVWEG